MQVSGQPTQQSHNSNTSFPVPLCFPTELVENLLRVVLENEVLFNAKMSMNQIKGILFTMS